MPQDYELLAEEYEDPAEDVSPLGSLAADEEDVYSGVSGKSSPLSEIMLQRAKQLSPRRQEVTSRRDALLNAYKQLIAAQKNRPLPVNNPATWAAGNAGLMESQDPNMRAFGAGQIARQKAMTEQNNAETESLKNQAMSQLQMDATGLGFLDKDQASEMDLLKQASMNDYRQQMLDMKMTLAAMKNSAGAQPKPLSATALKIQNEALTDLNFINPLTKDIGQLVKAIEDKKLDLGTFTNIGSEIRNKAGTSSENSRNYATFMANLEKIRNDSLRLNKGTQTEGDATRAWDELIKNTNDEKLVLQRLKEIQEMNSRAADLKKLTIDQLRSEYGHEPLDYSKYDVKSAILNGDEEGEKPLKPYGAPPSMGDVDNSTTSGSAPVVLKPQYTKEELAAEAKRRGLSK